MLTFGLKCKIRLVLITAIAIISNYACAQNRELRGKVLFGSLPVDNALIIIEHDSSRVVITSDQNGIFNKKDFKVVGDSLRFQISRIGFLTFDTTVSSQSRLSQLTFVMKESQTSSLETVTVKGRITSVEVNRKVYRVNPKEYISNISSINFLQKLPDLSVIGEKLKLESGKDVVILIDDIESSYKDLERLTTEQIDKVEIVSNPSAIYTGDAAIALLRVTTKVDKGRYIKGDVSLYKGVRLNSQGFSPSVSFKSKKVIFTSYLSYGTNNQNIYLDLQRRDVNSLLLQNSYRDVNGWQLSSNAKAKISLGKLSNLVIGGNTFGYRFNGSQNGALKTTNGANKDFQIIDLEKLTRISLSANYFHPINTVSQLYIKGKFYRFRNVNESQYSDMYLTLSYLPTISKTDEFSTEGIYAINKIDFLKGLSFNNTSLGIKSILRNFNYQNNNFDSKQYVSSVYANSDFKIGDKISSSASLLFEMTNNKVEKYNQTYWNFLPVLTVLYKINDTSNLHFDYSRRILRPGANFLNPNVIYLSPTQLYKGRLDLLPQVRDRYEITYSNKFRNEINFSSQLYLEKGFNSITETYTKRMDTVITSYDNVGRYTGLGGYIGLTTVLFKKVSLNLGSGLFHSTYSGRSDSSLITSNEGITFYSNVSLSIRLKDRIYMAINSNVNTPNYTLNNRIVTRPIINSTVSGVLIKDKLNATLNFYDLFAINKKTNFYSKGIQFSQQSQIINNTSNVSISLSFRFGKKFNERFQNSSITTDDLKSK